MHPMRNLGQAQMCESLDLGTILVTVVVIRPRVCMSEFSISSQKSGSDAEPGASLVELWNASPRGIALMAMVNMVAVARMISRFEKSAHNYRDRGSVKVSSCSHSGVH